MKREDEIEYVENGGTTMNFYNPHRDQVILDKNLLNYPNAHDYIKSHELKHQQIGFNLKEQIKHDFKNDLFLYFSTSEEAKEVREYLFKDPDHFTKFHIHDLILNSLRVVWCGAMPTLGLIYRKILR